MRIVRIRLEDRPVFQERVAALERLATYPLGDDTFQLDHGRDYWAFFDRLGEVLYAAALDGERVVAVGCGVLRRVGRTRSWYLCDAKVHPEHRGRKIPLAMLRRFFLWNYLRAPRGYAITMEPRDGESRIVRVISHWRWSPIRPVARLAIWSLEEAAARAAAPLVAKHRGGVVSYLSLRGVKDLVLGSTGAALPLLHVQWGDPVPGASPEPLAGHVHMVSAPVDDPLAAALRGLGLEPSAHARVLAHRMGGCDFSFVRTSEI